MNQSRPTRRCVLGGAGRAEDEEVAAGLAVLAEEEAGRVMDGDLDDDDGVGGSGLALELRWTAGSL
jgi:hypothetical protein